MTTFQGRVPELGRCGDCGAVVLLDSFRSREDVRRYRASEFCQECQDVASAGVSGPDEFRLGVLVGFATRGPDDVLAGATPELGLLPFEPPGRFSAGSRWYRWEPRFVCRVGTGTRPVDAWNELGPMASRWGGCQVRVREYDPGDQRLVEHLSQFALVVGPYRDWLARAVDRFPALAHSVSVDLCAELDWDDRFAYPLVPLWRLGWAVCPFVPRADEPCSALRACALVAAALEDVAAFPGSPGRPMDLLLDAVPLRAERVSAGQPS